MTTVPAVPDRGPVTLALIAMLDAATPFEWGDVDAKVGVTLAVEDYPYGLVDAQPGGTTTGDIALPEATVDWTWQITGVGLRRSSAEKVSDAGRHALLDRSTAGGFANPIVVAGLTIMNRRFASTGGVLQEGRVVNLPNLYTLTVSLL